MVWCGPGAVVADAVARRDAGQIDTATRSLWRYRAAFPFAIDDPITLGEGVTPLIPSIVSGVRVLLKCEWFNPTCSFKDRGASVMLSLLRSQGIEHVLEDSSGNGGVAVAAYAAAGGMAATILTPASTSPAKTVQMRAHGARVELIPGSRQDTADAALARSDFDLLRQPQLASVLLAGDKDPGLRVVGGPGLPAARQHHHPMRRRIERAGLRDRFFGIAPCRARSSPASDIRRPASQLRTDCRGVHGRGEAAETVISPTMAEGTAIAHPIRMREVLGTLRETRGGAVTLTEREIAEATLDLARVGIFVEPTSAQVAAAFSKLLETGTITPEQTTVLVMTGTGLKATPRIAGLLGIAL